MKRRILSSLMALVLVFGLLPATAFAEGETVPDGKAKIGDTEYETLDKALEAAQDGATIYLGKGTYNGNMANPTEQGKGAGKSLTFVGAGTGETTWQIMATKNYSDSNGNSDGWCDYSFQGSDRITFENMTVIGGVSSDGTTTAKDTQGLTYIQHITLKNCIFNGRADYWGYQSTTFEKVTFNAPGTKASGVKGVDYSLWTYTGNSYTFKNCTFNSAGKTVNVYRHSDAGYDIVVNFEGCTVNNTSSNKAVLNINDSNMGGSKFILNISGNNTVSSSVSATGNGPFSWLYKTRDSQTCSRLFGYSKEANNTGRTSVKFNGETVWEDGKMVNAKAYHTEGVKVDDVTYDNGGSGAKDILYAEGYKDNAFTDPTYSEWKNNPDGSQSREGTKKCKYCDYEVTFKERKEAEPINWDVPKSKTATQLDTNTWTSDVTLSLLNTKETLAAGKDHIGAGSTVTDTIGKKFDFVGIKSLTVGGKPLTMVNDDKDKNTWYFGNDKTVSAADYRFMVVYDSTSDSFVWTINEKVTQSEPVQLTYAVKLTKHETAPGNYGVEDLKGENQNIPDEKALYTNESAVLNAKNSAGVPVEKQEFPKPSVSYTISSGTGGDDGDDDDKYFFAIQKVDAQDGHALNGAKFGLYLDGKQVATATSNRSGIAMFRVNESDYRKINAKSDLYYQELTAPEGYVVNSDEVSIEKSNLTTSWSKAEKDAETVRNYRGTTPDLLNDSDHFAYVIGYMDGNVRPYGLISRAETTTIFFRLLKDSVRDGNLLTSNTYTDVADDYWANTAISTMTGLGIVQGRSTTTFDPKAPITRAQFAAICARFDTGKSSGTQTFTDIKGHWAEKYIQRAAELGWIKGFEDGTFRPDTYITRAQAMTMINRVLNRIPEDESDLLPGMNVWPDCNPGDWFYLAVQEATNSHDFKHKAGNYEIWTELTKNPDWTRYEH